MKRTNNFKESKNVRETFFVQQLFDQALLLEEIVDNLRCLENRNYDFENDMRLPWQWI